MNKPSLPQDTIENIVDEMVTTFGWAAPSTAYLLRQVSMSLLLHHIDPEV